ncbi:LuxR C-terminal-related transcriptional regulator [Blautia wexlerae]
MKKKIAKNLFISERTLYNHIQNIYDKLEVSNTVEAYNKAIKLGYIEPLM